MRVLVILFLVCFLGGQLIGQDQISQKNALEWFEGESSSNRLLFFFIEDCPACQNVAHKIVRIAEDQSANRVEVLGVYLPAKGYDSKLDEFIRDFSINFPVVQDPDLYWVKRFSATVTPEVVLLDRNGEIIYQGAVDNYYYKLGKHRRAPTKHYLMDAIEALNANRPVETSYVEPIGCFIH
jgi:thioredoxin-related protein